MEYTEQQKAEFRQEFKVKRRRQIILAIPVVLCMVLLFSVADKKEAPTIAGLDASVLLPPLFVLILAAVGYSFYNWRCPACNKYLGKSVSPSFCTRCGVALQ